MLYTRCPACETTFRVTEAALQQAGGKVRCGRCTHIFDAGDSLTDRLEDPDDAEATGAADIDSRAVADDGPGDDDSEPVGDSAGDDDSERGGDTDDSTGDGENSPMSSADVVAVLDAPLPAPPDWLSDSENAVPKRSRTWLAAAAVAIAALGAQIVHHNRAAVAENRVVGPLLERVYAAVGEDLGPQWSPEQYELLDWIAVADPAQTGHGNLIIRSRLLNSADRPQPYPLIWLRLLDRWEDTVAARLFRPDEYLASSPDATMMAPGVPVGMELVLVDPGTDAYGFELAVCTEKEQLVHCDTDATFSE